MIPYLNNKIPRFRKTFLLAGQVIVLVNGDSINNDLFKVSTLDKNETNSELYVLKKIDFVGLCEHVQNLSHFIYSQLYF